jgi:rhomboid protease GluP
MSDERRSWIDFAVKAAPYFFLNPVKVRWRLENWRRRRTETARRREQQVEHIRYQHKTCAACGAVQDRDATACSRCGEPLGRRSFQVLQRLGVFTPEWVSMSSLLGLAFVLAFGRVLLAAPGGLKDVFGLDARLLFDYGAHFPPAVAAGEVWRLLTACFLHGGLLHLGFNLFALAVVGPQVESLYGRASMLFFFVLTGVLANIGSDMAGLDTVQIGASGGLMGLVGIAAGWGQRQGTAAGRQVRNDMLKWAAYVILFGFFLRADNWAHFFGLATGFVVGVSLRPVTWRKRILAPTRALVGLAGLAAAVTALVLIARPPAVADAERADQRAAEHAAALEDWARVCKRHDAGDKAGALEAGRALIARSDAEDAPNPAALDESALRGICDHIARMRDACTRSSDPNLRDQCAALERADRSK